MNNGQTYRGKSGRTGKSRRTEEDDDHHGDITSGHHQQPRWNRQTRTVSEWICGHYPTGDDEIRQNGHTIDQSGQTHGSSDNIAWTMMDHSRVNGALINYSLCPKVGICSLRMSEYLAKDTGIETLFGAVIVMDGGPALSGHQRRN